MLGLLEERTRLGLRRHCVDLHTDFTHTLARPP